jgi:proteasome accessory factor B
VDDAPNSLRLGTDEKTERLLNLVIALLGTKTFMKKSEILREIPGYTGSVDARERMFERDKEELRKIGMPIQVSSLDPLFDDEQGYRISKSEYGFQLGPLNAEEYLVVNAATELMRSKIDSNQSKGLKRRILAAATEFEPAETSPLTEIRQGFDLPDSRVVDVLVSIQKKRRITFDYQGEARDCVTSRTVSPRAVGRKGEEWFLVGFDHERNELRTFNLFQIFGEIESGEGTFYSEPVDVKAEFSGFHKRLEEVTIRVETQFAPFFEGEGGHMRSEDEGVCEFDYQVPSLQRLFRILLSITSKFTVVAPEKAIIEYKTLREKFSNGR